jgi:hypothetical protein
MVESSIICTHPLNRSNQLVQELVAGSDHAAAAEGEAAAQRPSCFHIKNRKELKEKVIAHGKHRTVVVRHADGREAGFKQHTEAETTSCQKHATQDTHTHTKDHRRHQKF